MEGQCDGQIKSGDPTDLSFATEESSDQDSTIPLYIVIANPSESDTNDKLDIDENSDKSITDSKVMVAEQKSESKNKDDKQTAKENVTDETPHPEPKAVSEKKNEMLSTPVLDSPKSDSSVKPKISRELKGLQKAAAESKIITEFTNITEKMRSRKNLNSPNTNRIKETESSKKMSDCKSNEIPHTGDEDITSKSAKAKVTGKTPEQKKSVKSQNLLEMTNKDQEHNNDMFCWQCHKEGVNISCQTCPRSFHIRCMKGKDHTTTEAKDWCCVECLAIIQAETTDTRSDAMKQMSLTHLCELLKFALQRMTDYVGAEPFLNPVDKVEFPDYTKYVVHPMDLSQLEHNIKKNLYGSTEAFIADTKWILHNSIIYNSFHTKVTSVAKGIIKVCKQEMNEIETCPECYLKANTNNDTNWFLEVCSQPHMLVWAKLKGYPYWPAKAMTTAANGLVDVRFFGAHDKAWIPMKDCLLYSEKDPNFSDKGKRSDFVESVKELMVYIKNLEKRFGKFSFAPFKTPYPADQATIYNMMLPSYKYKPSEKKLKGIKPQIKNNRLNKSAKSENNKEDSKVAKTITNEGDEDSMLDGYGTEDDEILNCSVKDNKSDICTPDEVENDIQAKITPLRGSVRMRGGKVNSTGKIKIMNITKKAELDKSTDSPKLSQQNEPIKNEKNVIILNDPNKTNKRKISIEKTDGKEKRIKQDIGKNINVMITQSEQKKTVQNDSNVKIEKSENVKTSKSNNDNETKITPSKQSRELNKPFKIMDKLPQISIVGLPKGITIPKSNSGGIKTNVSQISNVGKTTVILRKRSSLVPIESGGKKQSPISENKEKEINNIPKILTNKSISLENLEKFELDLNKNTNNKTNLSPSTEISKGVTIPMLSEVKTEPLEEEELNETGSTISDHVGQTVTEMSKQKKQSARKTFPNKSAIEKQNISQNKPPLDSMVNVHGTCIPDPPLNYQMASSAIETFTMSRNCDTTKTSTMDSLSTAVSCRESDAGTGQQQVDRQQSSSNQHNSRHVLGPMAKPLSAHFPSDCGPVTKLLNDNALKFSDYFRSLLQETLVDFSNLGSTDAHVKKLQAEVESLKWLHKQELQDLKHNTEIILWEMRNSFELSNARALAECRKQAETERIRYVQETKSKQR